MESNLSLSEKLYVLAIHPEKGGINSWSSSAIGYVLIGSLLMELYFNRNIVFNEKKVVVKETISDNKLHRFMLEKMEAKKPKKISYWVNRFNYSMRFIKGTVRESLNKKRVIQLHAKRFLFFKWKKPVLANKTVVYKLVRKIDQWIFKGTSKENDLILLSFLEPAALLRRLYPQRQKRKQARKKLKQLMVENCVPVSVANAITAAQAVAASVAVTVATTSATN
jgi:hypothetical protein